MPNYAYKIEALLLNIQIASKCEILSEPGIKVTFRSDCIQLEGEKCIKQSLRWKSVYFAVFKVATQVDWTW